MAITSEKCTQKTANQLINRVIHTATERVNSAICFYKKRPSTQMKNALEDTLLDVMPFAEIVAQENKQGQELLEILEKINDQIATSQAFEFIDLTQIFFKE